MARNRIPEILSILKKTYPGAKIVLNYSNNWELLVSVVLSAQCTDVRVNLVTAKLFKKYLSRHSEATPRGRGNLIANRLPRRPAKAGLLAMTKEMQNFASVPLSELEQDIKSTGFYHHKAKNIQGAARMILDKYNGKIPDTMEEILKLPGVARKTGNVVLGNAYHKVEGIAVDTHVLRISQRLRLVDIDKINGKKPLYFNTGGAGGVPGEHRSLMRCRSGVQPSDRTRRLDYFKDAKPEKVEQELMKILPKKDWFKFTYQIIDHGRAICKAQNPNCKICPLSQLCPASRIPSS